MVGELMFKFFYKGNGEAKFCKEQPKNADNEYFGIKLQTKEISKIIQSRLWSTNFKEVRQQLKHEFEQCGFSVKLEQPVKTITTRKNSKRTLKVNMVVSKNSASTAIEIDRNRAKSTSLKKLWSFPGQRVLLIRNSRMGDKPITGINAVFDLRDK